MTKRFFTLVFALVAIATTAQAQVVLNETNFPDANFRAALASKFGISEGDEITEAKIAATTSLNVSNKSISDLTGIEHFTALEWLACSNNQLTSLDVSQNTAIKNLRCYGNKINGEAMEVLVTSLPTVEGGQFYVINAKDANEGNICMKSQVAIAKGKGWTVYDYGYYTQYEGCDPNIKAVVFNAENFPDANFRAALASILGISEGDEITEAKIAIMTQFSVHNNSIADLTGIEHFTELTNLYCENTQLTSLDLTKNTALKSLYCKNNKLVSLNVSGCTALTQLYCENNQLTSLNVSGCTALTTLHCYSGGVWAWASAEGNQLTELDVSECTALTDLRCHNNQLKTLDVSGCTKLWTLVCHHNQLTSLDVSDCTSLSALKCDNNQLASLDVSQNVELRELHSFTNKIKGEAMDALVGSLPTASSTSWKYSFYVIDMQDENEGNICTKSQVAVAKEKGWTVYDANGGKSPYPEYEGSDDEIILDEENFSDTKFREALSGILNMNEGEEITEEVIDNTTTLDVSDKAIANLSGIEHFTALTTLYCHINQIKNEEMAALIAALPDLSSNEAKGMMRAEETNPRTGALYALDFTDENEQNVCTAEHVAAANEKGWTVYCKTANGWQEYDGEVPTGIGAPLNDNGEMTNDSWYTIDGVKLNGEPTQKGVYIVNGRKVVK